jgi:2-desacetyl-2-hydroxyethyl bacteriochlorophyllide A dehydrogenase
VTRPETSIVIRTFNEERDLPRLFEAIQGQRYKDFEVIDVDSGSYDRTTAIAQEYGARLLRISPRDFTFGYSLNVGVEAALRRFIVLVSAHTEPHDDLWLENLIAPLRSEGVAMVYGRQYGTAKSKFGELRDLARTFGPERKVMAPPKFFANNANSALLKELWEGHPFDEILPGQEDIEWAKHWMERGYKVIYEPASGIYHKHDESWRQVKLRYYREAVATRAIGVWGSRNAVGLAAREVRYLAGDALASLRQGELRSRWREIVTFRALKAYGTVSGLVEPKATPANVVEQGLFYDRKCKTVVVRGPNRAALEEIDVPPTRPGDLLVNVAYAGVTNMDLGLMKGDRSFHSGHSPPYPAVPGGELSGWVARVGPKVSHVKEGDPVVVQSLRGCGSCRACLRSKLLDCEGESNGDSRSGTGAYSEYVSVPGISVHKLPAGTDMREAVLVEALAVVLRGLRRVERLLDFAADIPRFTVVGAGPMGHLCALALSSRELPVTIFDRNTKRLAYLKDAPVETGSDSAGLERFDVLVEATGDPEFLESLVQASKSDAVLLLLGLPASRRQFTIRGAAAGEKTILWSAGAEEGDFQEAARMLPRLDTEALTDYAVPLSRFAEAWDSFSAGDRLKVLIEVSTRNEQLESEGTAA